MPIKTYRPTTPARRKTSVNKSDKLTRKVKPVKSLLKAKKIRAGRNSQGRITVRHQGGGHKRQIRIVDFQQDKFDIPAKITSVEYDPNRSAYVGLAVYKDGEKRYVLLAEGVNKGDKIVTTEAGEIKEGSRMIIKNIPVGTMVHNVELHRGEGGKLIRSAGQGSQVMAHEGGKTQLMMPSSEVRLVPDNVLATVGKVSNFEHSAVRVGKAGRKRHMGIRPTVRGSVMNPCDHPHGGGEGKAPIGRKSPMTPWGKKAYGVKTRRKNRYSDKDIVSRRKKKR